MTLGAEGVLARAGGAFVYEPGFVVDCIDTTEGAGDVFHGAFCYSVQIRGCLFAKVSNFPMQRRR